MKKDSKHICRRASLSKLKDGISSLKLMLKPIDRKRRNSLPFNHGIRRYLDEPETEEDKPEPKNN